MNEIGKLQDALDALIQQNATLHYQLALAEAKDTEDAQLAAAVSAVLAVANAKGFTADTLPEEDLERVLEKVDMLFAEMREETTSTVKPFLEQTRQLPNPSTIKGENEPGVF